MGGGRKTEGIQVGRRHPGGHLAHLHCARLQTAQYLEHPLMHLTCSRAHPAPAAAIRFSVRFALGAGAGVPRDALAQGP